MIEVITLKEMKNDNINRFEQRQRDLNTSNFIKSYWVFNRLPINPTEIKLIELILSFTDKGQDFYMNYKDIAVYLNISVNYLNKIIKKLKTLNYISTKVNRYGSNRGSSTTIKINEDIIDKELDRFELEGFKASTPTEKPTEKPIEPTTPIEDKPRLKVVKSEPVAKIEPIETPQQVEPVQPIEPVELPNDIDMDKELSIEEIIMMCNIDKDKVTDRKHLTKRLNEFKTRELYGGGYLKLTPTNLIKTVLSGSEYRYYMHRFNDYINGRIAV